MAGGRYSMYFFVISNSCLNSCTFQDRLELVICSSHLKYGPHGALYLL